MTTTARPAAGDRRRPQLAAFLRSRRARIAPQDLGLPPGPRRRTPGLRREEVAQAAGVGVTWYTWLEQGRPINASAQVLDAVARTLRLDETEREHLYHLAEVPFAPALRSGGEPWPAVGDDVQAVLDALAPLPAVIYDARYDVLAGNDAYWALFSGIDVDLARMTPGARNAVRLLFGARPERCPLVFKDSELKSMVATLRSAYGAHAGEPAWERFIRELVADSPEFAAMWASGDVVPPGPRIKMFRHEEVGEIRLRSTSMSIHGVPEARMVVYIPGDEETRLRVERLREINAGATGR
ncbi:helix-turn-helix transcriptional regulator [Streptomyces radicis]|uniref:XRE family transcriptional regulator n=1 Tax=Streptomyces radicis TaxID=1750517 RepID=A0A3A9WDF8_9ACTN|nr:helix-turn-helix transcriptional regulator [Streptomyces radicis]RKN11015.1 XRE family transcriptional regulator [Streptomyces radicis]RKN25278.1 XRE family transcriptional regulator [Streptomyces radicis]